MARKSNEAPGTLGAHARLLVDVDKAAEMLSVSVRYIRALLTRGGLPVVRLGRRTLIRCSDIEAMVARGALADEARAE
jgi:excisionase family DNA binding protein